MLLALACRARAPTPLPAAAPRRALHIGKPDRLFDKVLIANRGEIACRVMRTCRRLGIKTVAVYSTADEYSLHRRMADESVCIGPPPSAQSYLQVDAILEAVRKTGAQAVHPGYGFLSENAVFSQALADHGVAFCGPDASAMHAMGDKIESKRLANAHKVSCIPGFVGEVHDEAELLKVAKDVGYPIMVKASAGGGGKGMRIAWNDKEAVEGFRMSKAEAKASFGDDRMLIERYIDDPRHIEIQVIGDKHGNILYLPERECSIQRRNQKVTEEAPSVHLDAATRQAMGEEAVMLARAVNYHSAGTVEFLCDPKRNFYFLEMNTRLQVEHPITEYITGLDLVELMLRVAAGQKLPLQQSDIKINGWAMESRVYAEDPKRNFLPSIGLLHKYVEPPSHAGNIRCDAGVTEGSQIQIHYDPLICKLVTHGKTRAECLQTMRYALDSYVIRGVNHNINFLRAILNHPRFVSGAISTKFIQEEYPHGFKGHTLSSAETDQLFITAAIIRLMRARRDACLSDTFATHQPPDSAGYVITLDDQERYVSVFLHPDDPNKPQHDDHEHDENCEHDEHDYHEDDKSYTHATVQFENEHGDVSHAVEVAVKWAIDSDIFTATLAGEETSQPWIAQVSSVGPEKQDLILIGSNYEVKVEERRTHQYSKYMIPKVKADMSMSLVSPMPGRVVAIEVKVGDRVVVGQPLAVVEAMKMQNLLRSEKDARVKAIHKNAGQDCQLDEVLIEFEPLVMGSATASMR